MNIDDLLKWSCFLSGKLLITIRLTDGKITFPLRYSALNYNEENIHFGKFSDSTCNPGRMSGTQSEMLRMAGPVGFPLPVTIKDRLKTSRIEMHVMSSAAISIINRS